MAGDRQLAGGTLVPLLDAVIRLAPVPMVVSDRRGRFLAANHQWQVLQGETATEPQGWLDHLDALSRHRLLEDLERTAATGDTSSIDLEMRMPPGCRWTRWWLQRREIDDEVVVVMAVIDVHDDVSQKDDLREMAIRDDLTGLLNRRFFHEAAEQALRRAERFSEAACVLYVDLDGFKSVNDQAGHHTGDQVLTAVAARLRQAVRAADVVGRIGGDEFAVLIERLPSPAEAAIVSRRVEEALNGSVEVDGEEWPLAASVGMAISRSGHDSADELMSRADQAMYLAKRSRTVATGPPETGDPPEERSGERPGERPEVPVERSGERPEPPVDMRSLKDGVDQIRRSLESLLRDLAGEPD